MNTDTQTANQVKEMLYHRLASHASQLLTALWSDPKCDIADLKAAGFESVGGKSIEPLTVSPEPSEPDRWSDFKESLHAEACRWAESIYKGLRRMNVWPAIHWRHGAHASRSVRPVQGVQQQI